MKEKIKKVITQFKRKTGGGSCTSEDLEWFESVLLKMTQAYNKDPETILSIMLENNCGLYWACTKY